MAPANCAAAEKHAAEAPPEEPKLRAEAEGEHQHAVPKGLLAMPAAPNRMAACRKSIWASSTVTAYQPVSSSTLFISFHLYGSVTERQTEEFDRRLEDNKHRIRDNIIVIVRSAEITDLTDAGLGLIKRRILETTNKALGKPLLQGVMFSEFSFVEQ